MSSRSLNKVLLIGNLTRDPELRYTPQGTAVCSFGLATNRSWTTDSNDKREETEFHRVVAWNKLAELCSQLLFKGRKVYIEGRLSTRSWTAQDGTQRQTTEIVAEEMIILDNRMAEGGDMRQGNSMQAPNENSVLVGDAPVAGAASVVDSPEPVASVVPVVGSGDFSIDDIPDDLGVTEPVSDVPVEDKPVVAPTTKTKTKSEKTADESPVKDPSEAKTEDKKADGDIPF